MKVGILTFHNTVNYGAQLQSYALYSVLQDMGHSVEVADYRNPAVAFRETPRKPGVAQIVKHPRTSLRSLWSFGSSERRRSEFERFARDRVTFSDPLRGQGDIAGRYDAVVVGSDQVWNPLCTKGDLTYFLDTPECDTLRRVSYAASFGSDFFPVEFSERCAKAIAKFDSISVREVSGVEIVKSLTGRRAELVLDPTLLLERERWNTIASPRIMSGRYVFAYVVAERANTIRFAREAAKKAGAELVVVDCYGTAVPFLGRGCRNDVSLEDFLSLVSHADLVVTSSFHGLALSLALGSQVCYSLNEKAGNRNSRLESLAKVAGVESCNIARSAPRGDIDFSLVDDRLASARSASLRYLEAALA